ncbi:hypothetical protein IW261DRAFT_1554161 [Armillaria novae-zelandiae]|uniref:SWIM-type domain-containing protein n=1 Tax=Armillaria novae-zelandiae TaxID=153914 RepID=A0AA39TYV3_9AGAR|nr:hypothetical protein IW261DRAFT_1554161 [Armillaria novae-zelandiae]
MEDEIYSCREHWASAWISTVFTAGVHTNGHVEVENRWTKLLGGPQTSLKQFFDALCTCTEHQSKQHDHHVHEHVVPFVLQVCFKHMELSMMYKTELLQRLEDVKNWHMIATFKNDQALISTCWLLNLILQCGLTVIHLLQIQHLGQTGATHYLAVLADGRHVCNFCMVLNLGIPCRHFFQALAAHTQGLHFSIGLIHSR